MPWHQGVAPAAGWPSRLRPGGVARGGARPLGSDGSDSPVSKHGSRSLTCVRAEGSLDTLVRNEGDACLGEHAATPKRLQQHPTWTREGVGGECAR